MTGRRPDSGDETTPAPVEPIEPGTPSTPGSRTLLGIAKGAVDGARAAADTTSQFLGYLKDRDDQQTQRQKRTLRVVMIAVIVVVGGMVALGGGAFAVKYLGAEVSTDGTGGTPTTTPAP